MHRIAGVVQFIVVLCLVLSKFANSQTAVGLYSGVNMVGMTGDSPQSTKYSSGTGFLAGVYFDLNLTKDIKLSFQPNYSSFGTVIGYDVNEEDYKDSLKLTMNYYRFPVIVSFEALNNITYFSSGIDLGFFKDATMRNVSKTDPETDISSYFNNIDLAVAFGVGVKFPVSSFGIKIEGRYIQSILNASSGKSLDQGSSLLPRFRYSGFQFDAGVAYKF